MLIIITTKEIVMKSKVQLALALASITVLAGCAGNSGKSGKFAKTEEGDKICRFEKTTGSHIGSKVCRTQAQIDAEKEAAQQALRTLNQPRTNNKG